MSKVESNLVVSTSMSFDEQTEYDAMVTEALIEDFKMSDTFKTRLNFLGRKKISLLKEVKRSKRNA